MAAPAPTSASVASATPLPSSAAQAASASASASPLSSSESSGVLVVGGGVMGLSVVLQLLRSGYKHVTIIAEKFSPDTTSDGAGASLRPGGDYTAPSPARDRMQRWGEETSSFLFGLRRDLGAQKSGITLASGYEFWDGPREYPFWRGQVFGMRDVPPEEMKAIGYTAPYAWFYTTGIVDVSCYLAWLTEEVKKLGGEFIKAKVESLTRLRVAAAQWNRAHASADPAAALAALRSNAATDLVSLPAPLLSLLQTRPHFLVVNCAGLGSKWMVPDPQVLAAKGCVLRVKCPGLTHFYTNLPHGSYIIPRRDDVVLGGSMVLADYSLDVPQGFRDHILGRAGDIIPEVRGAEVTLEWAGLRPYREEVRLELVRGAEPPPTFPAPKLFPVSGTLQFKQAFGSRLTEGAVEGLKAEEAARLAARSTKEVEWESQGLEPERIVPVIHNYGHSGSGITLHWGCALEVVSIAMQLCPPPQAKLAPA